MATSTLPQTDSLRALQSYIWQMNKERGFNTEDAAKKMLMLTEEMADVLIVLLGLSSVVEVDAYQAFLAKETKNHQRHWR